MTRESAALIFGTLLCGMLCLLGIQPVLASNECRRVDTAQESLDVWDRLPAYSTNSGWTYGNKIATLSRGTVFHICEDKHVGFFFSKEKWLRIFWDRREGWIVAPKRTSELLDRSWVLGVSRAFANDKAPSSRGLGDPLTLGSFFAIILGMVGKNVFDLWQGDRGSIKGILSHAVPALIISPVVFLTFIKNADLGVDSNSGMIVLYLFAFQNGFFWQDVMSKRTPAAAGSPKAPV